MKKIIPAFVFLALMLIALPNCKKKTKDSDAPTGTCSDGIKNQNETNTDCGGVCSVCQTCSDGIKNQGETDVDCGGPCGLCPITYPVNGLYGANLISDTITHLVSGPFPPNGSNKPYSVACKLLAGTSIRVRLTCSTNNIGSTPRPWAYDVSSVGTWKIVSTSATVMDLYNDSEKNPDLKLTFWGDGTGKIEIFENGAETPVRTKLMSWNQ